MSSIVVFALLSLPSLMPQQVSAPQETSACRRTLSGRPYTAGDTLNMRLDLSSSAGVTYKAELSFTPAQTGEPKQATRPVNLIAFGVLINKAQTRFSFQIPQEHMAGVYMIAGLVVREVPGGIVSSSSQALDAIVGTCVQFSDAAPRGVGGGIRGGEIEPRSAPRWISRP